MKKFEITIKFIVDKDFVPGFGHDPESWIELITRDVLRQKHYNTKAEVLKIEEIEK